MDKLALPALALLMVGFLVACGLVIFRPDRSQQSKDDDGPVRRRRR